MKTFMVCGVIYWSSYYFIFLQEHLNQEMAWKYQNIINCQTNDDRAYFGASSSHESSLPIHQASVGFGVSPCSYDRNLSYSGFNYSMPFNSGSSMLSNNDNANYNSQYFQRRSLSVSFSSPFLPSSIFPPNSLVMLIKLPCSPKVHHSWSF